MLRQLKAVVGISEPLTPDEAANQAIEAEEAKKQRAEKGAELASKAGKKASELKDKASDKVTSIKEAKKQKAEAKPNKKTEAKSDQKDESKPSGKKDKQNSLDDFLADERKNFSEAVEPVERGDRDDSVIGQIIQSEDDSISFDDMDEPTDTSDDSVNTEDTANATTTETDSNEEDNNMAAANISRQFYDEIGFDMGVFDASQGKNLSPNLRDWIIKAAKLNPELAKGIILESLPTVVKNDPSLAGRIVETAAATAAQVADAHIKYRMIFTDKMEGKGFISLREANDYATPYIEKLGIGFWDVMNYDFHEIDEDGHIGKKVSDDTVLKYAENFPGDKDRLRRVLYLDEVERLRSEAGAKKAKSSGSNQGAKKPNKKKGNGQKPQPKQDSAKAGKSDQSKSDNQNGNTGDNQN